MMSVTRSLLLKILCRRSFHTCRPCLIDKKQVEEVKIPVPWGHVAGRWWGSKDKQPILGLHGWQDNAGTWDPLLKLMPDNYSVLTIDFPGSGLSSHLPPFQHYHFVDSVYVIQLIKQHYEFGPMTLLGHSGGSATAFIYSGIYPENVNAYFGIDYVLYAYANHQRRAQSLGKNLDKIINLALRDPTKAKKYSWTEAKSTWVAATFGSVSENSAEILMQRGVTKQEDGSFVFSRDSRLKTSLVEASSVLQVENIASNINCHVTLIQALKSPLFEKGIKNCPHILDIIKKKAKSYEFHKIDGGHHLHMDLPQIILPLLLRLLSKLEPS